MKKEFMAIIKCLFCKTTWIPSAPINIYQENHSIRCKGSNIKAGFLVRE